MVVWDVCGSDGGFGFRGLGGGYVVDHVVKVMGCVGRVAVGCGGYGLWGLCGGGYGSCCVVVWVDFNRYDFGGQRHG